MSFLLRICTIIISFVSIWVALVYRTIHRLRVPTLPPAGSGAKLASISPVAQDTATTPSDTTASESTGNDVGTEPSSTSPLVSSQPEQQRKDGDMEEGRGAYHPGGFHPVYIGDIYDGRYQVLSKLGWGSSSTVWLVKDLQSGPEDKTPYRAMKVLSAIEDARKHENIELGVLWHLRSAMPDAYGYRFICHLLDDFMHVGPNGTHICLIFEPMGETLGSFIDLWHCGELPSDLMKILVAQLALAVDYAHHVGVIHCDIKSDNIFVKVRDWSLLESDYLIELPHQPQDRTAPYKPIRSCSLMCHYCSEEDMVKDYKGFELVLGDFGVARWTDVHQCDLIQPRYLRSPEVLLGSFWDESTDWWNLGAVMFEMYGGVRMFEGAGADGRYEVRRHLNEIVDMFGPFPAKLLREVRSAFVEDHFNDDGTVRGVEAISLGRGLESVAWMEELEEEDRREFAKALRGMMSIYPGDRWDMYDLLHSPWLRDVAYYVIERYKS